MRYDSEKRWSEARGVMIDRWRKIIDRIDAHDEGGVLTMANVMDEFCEEAAAIEKSTPTPPDSANPLPASLNVFGGVSRRCLFCRGFTDIGGCLGDLDALNRAVTDRKWQKAREVAEGYLSRLVSMRFDSNSEVHAS